VEVRKGLFRGAIWTKFWTNRPARLSSSSLASNPLVERQYNAVGMGWSFVNPQAILSAKREGPLTKR